jgi:hypothetical protein
MDQATPHFKPWQGTSFGAGLLGSKRLLIVGEAHYSDHPEDDRPELTIEMVRAIRDGERCISYFTKISSLLAPLAGQDSRTESIWDSVAFYNFIPGFVATAARV